MNNKYWRSLAELEQTPEFMDLLRREFPQAAAEYPEGVSRRRWLQLMGASLALGGLAGCRWEREIIAPEAMRAPNRIPGEPMYYATAREHGGVGESLVLTSYDGRPVKVEGNSQHPASNGATSQFAQASILEMYDPDRIESPTHRHGEEVHRSTWEEFEADFRPIIDRTGSGGGVAVLASASSSPTLADMKKRFLAKYPDAQWFEYESLSRDNESAGAEIAFGRPVRTHLKINAAKVIVALDSDFLRSHPDAVRMSREFSARRDPDAKDGMIRLYAIESQFSLAGANADHRLPVRSSEMAGVVAWIESLVAEGLKDAAAIENRLKEEKDADAKVFLAAVHDLVVNQGAGIITLGPGHAPELHARVHRLNGILGNAGKAVVYTDEPLAGRPSHVAALKSLVELMNGRQVGTLIILGGNPVYSAPADIDFSAALGLVDHVVRLGSYDDETSEKSEWSLPLAHAFESWGDTRTYDGTYTLMQPLIEPLLAGRSPAELLAMIIGDTVGDIPEKLAGSLGERLVRRTARTIIGNDESAWKKAVHDGFVAGSEFPAVSVSVGDQVKPGNETLGESKPANGALEVVFCESSHTYDGRFANNGWLMECPDFITKLTWENAAVLSPQTAEDLGVANTEMVEVSLGEQAIQLPAYILPGQAYGSIGLALGFGRWAAGVVGGYVATQIATVGVNVGPLRKSGAMSVATGASVKPMGKKVRFAVTQDHFTIDAGGDAERQRRASELIREANLDEYKEHPDFAQHIVHSPPLISLWKQELKGPHRWGMMIDLNKCTGCNACVTACQSENNIPIVGKQQVLASREMHWIRIDRYFRGDKANPEVAFQPLTCQQCENAPCEQVCPVAATIHSEEGLNDMVYNRCIGTRYCANNCPYKVRRFNYFHFTGYLDKAKEGNEILRRMVLNPEVTVRTRGVMEKCTYCVQRISAEKIKAKNNRQQVEDGAIRTACDQACPAGAITFGDLADPESKVSKLRASGRAYALLGEINTVPRTQYLGRVRNPHPLTVTEARYEHHGHGHEGHDDHEHDHEHEEHEGAEHAPAEEAHS